MGFSIRELGLMATSFKAVSFAQFHFLNSPTTRLVNLVKAGSFSCFTYAPVQPSMEFPVFVDHHPALKPSKHGAEYRATLAGSIETSRHSAVYGSQLMIEKGLLTGMF